MEERNLELKKAGLAIPKVLEKTGSFCLITYTRPNGIGNRLLVNRLLNIHIY